MASSVLLRRPDFLFRPGHAASIRRLSSLILLLTLEPGFVACQDLTTVVAREDRSGNSGGEAWGGSPNLGGESSSGGTSTTGGSETNGSGGVNATGGEGSAPTVRPRFDAPHPVVGVNDPVAKDQDPSLPEDQLELFFFSDRQGTPDLFHATRPSRDADWLPPVPISELNDETESDYNPTISADGLRIWFCSSRDPAGIWYSDRPSRIEPFSSPVSVYVDRLGEENLVIAPSLLPHFLWMAVSIGSSDTRDIYETTRSDLVSAWSTPALVVGINSDVADSTPHLFDGGRQILFASGRQGYGDLFWAYRTELSEAVTQVEALSELNDPQAFESYPHLTVDRTAIYFGSSRSGGTDIFMAQARNE